MFIHEKAVEKFITIRDLLSQKYSDVDKLINDDDFREGLLGRVEKLGGEDEPEEKEKKQTPWDRIVGIAGLLIGGYSLAKQEIKDANPSEELEAIHSLTKDFKAFKEEVRGSFKRDSIPTDSTHSSSIKRRNRIRALEMVRVEGGTFMYQKRGMNDKTRKYDLPGIRKTVRSFEIGKYPVTQKLWEDIMGENPSKFKGCPDCPVEMVSWDDTQKFYGETQ